MGNKGVKESLKDIQKLVELIDFDDEHLDFYQDELEERFEDLFGSLFKLYGLQQLCKNDLI